MSPSFTSLCFERKKWRIFYIKRFQLNNLIVNLLHLFIELLPKPLKNLAFDVLATYHKVVSFLNTMGSNSK